MGDRPRIHVLGAGRSLRQAQPRTVDVELTAKGRRLVDEAVVVHVAREKRMVEPLSAEERTELARLTRKLLAHLKADQGTPSRPAGRRL